MLEGLSPSAALSEIAICAALFAAMGLLFIVGFGASAAQGDGPLLARFKPHHLIPGFNEAVFMVFVALAFFVQVALAPAFAGTGVGSALEQAVYVLLPGQRALVDVLQSCAMVNGRAFAAAFTWLLAIIYLASTVSRLKLAAGLIRLEMGTRPQLLGPTLRAFLFGVAAIAGIQLLVVGSVYPWLGCGAYTDTDISGALLIGLAPLMLAYLILTALASLVASSPAKD